MGVKIYERKVDKYTKVFLFGGIRVGRFTNQKASSRYSRALRGLHAFVFALSLVPFEAPAADWSTGSFAPGALGGTSGAQTVAQTQNAGNNGMASQLGAIAAAVSMAAGGLYIAKGATQLKCCSSGCTGSGSSSEKAKTDIDNNTKKSVTGSGITGGLFRQPVDYRRLRFPDEAKACPAPRLPLFFEFLRPAKADAALGPCLDAAIAMATGGLLLLNGLMGMQAANQANQNAGASLANAGNMGGMSSAGTSPTPDAAKTDSAKFGAQGSSASPIKLDPALLRTGTANDIMGKFEKQFGIPRDQFAQSVMDGNDPRKILGSAPLNPLSNADMNKATTDARGMSDADKANALANAGLGDVQRDLASKVGEVNPAGGPATSGLAAFKKSTGGDSVDLDKLADEIGKPSESAALGVSPEVQAALAAKQLDERKNGITDLTIFEVVHLKYRERSKKIFGYDPDGAKGGGHGI